MIRCGVMIDACASPCTSPAVCGVFRNMLPITLCLGAGEFGREGACVRANRTRMSAGK